MSLPEIRCELVWAYTQTAAAGQFVNNLLLTPFLTPFLLHPTASNNVTLNVGKCKLGVNPQTGEVTAQSPVPGGINVENVQHGATLAGGHRVAHLWTMTFTISIKRGAGAMETYTLLWEFEKVQLPAGPYDNFGLQVPPDTLPNGQPNPNAFPPSDDVLPLT